MSESFRSAVALRNDICTSVDDLQQRYTAPLPNRATVYCIETASLYRLFKGFGSADDSSVGIVIPADGSSNRWLQEAASSSAQLSGVEAALATNSFAPGGANEWTALGTNPGTYALITGEPSLFDVDSNSSLLTYNGIPRFMMVTAIASIFMVNADTSAIVISRDDDVLAGSTADEPGKGEQSGTASTGDDIVNITTQRAISMAPGSTLRLMLRNVTGQVIQINQFSLSVVPLP